jgi:S1-C subfamily serine protease
LAARSAENTPQVWHYTLAAKSRGDYAGVLSAAEIAGFLAKVDEYTGSAPPAVLHRAAGAKPELGIGVLHVEASERQPARSGELVTAVSRGSAADKAGIIVGDIVHEIDGRLINSAADMQAAIAAAAANADIAIKVYRGTTEMTLHAPF